MSGTVRSADTAKTSRTRTIWIFGLFAALYLAVACCFACVQIRDHAFYVQKAIGRVKTFSVAAKRGGIFDRNGRPLATDIEMVSVFANLSKVDDRAKLACAVSQTLRMPQADVERKFSTPREFVYLSRDQDPGITRTIRRHVSDLPGIGTERKLRRVYSAGSLAAQTLGFTDVDNKGVEGLEHSLDGYLAGKDGRCEAEIGTRGRFIPETRRVIRSPEYGRNVYLTIDTTIQHAAETALNRMAQLYHPETACAIALDPHTGEVLALANYPSYDPNKARSVDPKLWRNRAVADLFEPGSTMKVVSVAAALSEGMSPNTVFARCTGRERIKGGVIPCVHGAKHGAVNMPKIIRVSCNIGAAHVAMKLGAERFYRYEKAFGFMDRIHAGFDGEAVGHTRPAKEWRPIELANNGFGQGVAVTPLHMAAAFAAIANGGVYVAPKIVREIRNPDSSVFRSFENPPVRRAVTPEAAREITAMMVDCVENGTGKPARIPGRQVAGKTGSAQVSRKNGRGYEPGAFISSFIGFAPAYQPRVVIAVVVVRPKGSHWGATVAAPVFKEIGEKALWRLKTPADKPLWRVGTPADKPRPPARQVKPVPGKDGRKVA